MVKRIVLGFFLSLVIVLCLGAPAVAAPTAVSLKTGAGANLIGLEVTIPVSDSFAFVVEGGTAMPLIPLVSASAGARYYFFPEGWRPFLSVYGTYTFAVDPASSLSDYATAWGTVGIEYQLERGFRFAAEIGGYYCFYFDDPTLNGPGLAWGLSIGYGF